MSEKNEVLKTKDRINKVSSSFCVAKWKQVTIHLHTGQTHSCHHPGTHTVPLSELVDNPSALHNTNYKKMLRKMMLNGQRPSECQYCWNIEDLGEGFISDRHIKSNDFWAEPHIDEIANLPWDANIAPSYVEVSFSHTCNFKCLYCYPHISSSWQAEIEKFGHIELDRPLHLISWWKAKGLEPRADTDNPYVEAFWRWLPDLYPSLKVLRVTGGEPLLSENTYKLLEYIEAKPHPDLDLAINSNLGVHPRFVEKLSLNIKKARNNVKSIRIYTSVDSWGPQAEYIRTGLDLEVFEKNIETLFAEIPDLKITFMCTFNLLSYFNFQELLHKILELKKKHSPNGAEVYLDISYLRHPEFLSLLLASDKTKEKLHSFLGFMLNNRHDWESNKIGFIDFEIEKMSRLLEYAMRGDLYFDLDVQRSSFKKFTKEMDERRKTNFPQVFPEMSEIYSSW